MWQRIWCLGSIGLVLLVIVSSIVDLAVSPIWNSATEASHDEMLVQHLRLLDAQKPIYRKAFDAGQRALGSQAALYRDFSAELASGQLQSTVQTLIVQSGGQIQSSAITAPELIHNLQVLSVNLSFNLPTTRLAGFLNAIEIAKPYLVVNSLDIRSTDYGSPSSLLDVQLQVHGFSDAP